MRYRIHRIKEAPKEHFRWAPHTGGLATVKLKDYEPAGEIDVASPYAAWKMMAESEPLAPGDILEALDENGQTLRLEICKYIGFEPASWFVPELKPELAGNSETDR
jgi:hypothetical protein